MQRATANGIEIAYCVDGEEAKPWLVLSNSLATDHRMWEFQLETLKQTHRLLRYDTRGHGQSQATDGAYSFELLVGDLIGLMDTLDIETADVLGLSLGGMTALGLALDHPERVNRLICCDCRADAPALYADFWRDRIEVARKEGLSALVDGTLERWLTDAFRSEPTNRPNVELARDMILSASVDGFCGCAAALTTLDFLTLLTEITTPTLCVVGSDDLAAPPDVMKAMAEVLPNGQVTVIENAAHVSNLNASAQFNEIVSGWLSR